MSLNLHIFYFSSHSQRDHKKIQRFRIYCILSLGLLALQFLFAIATIGQNRPYKQAENSMAPNIFAAAVSLAVNIYFFICINALYLKIKGERFPVRAPAHQPGTAVTSSPYIVTYQTPSNHPPMHVTSLAYPQKY